MFCKKCDNMITSDYLIKYSNDIDSSNRNIPLPKCNNCGCVLDIKDIQDYLISIDLESFLRISTVYTLHYEKSKYSKDMLKVSIKKIQQRFDELFELFDAK